MRKVYLDNAATTPILSEVLEAMLPYFKDVYGNPQSLHGWGDEAREAIEDARGRVAALIGAQTEEIIFGLTSAALGRLISKTPSS